MLPSTTLAGPPNPLFKVTTVLGRVDVAGGGDVAVEVASGGQGGTLCLLPVAPNHESSVCTPLSWPDVDDLTILVNGRRIDRFPRRGRNMPHVFNTFSPLPVATSATGSVAIRCVSHGLCGVSVVACLCEEVPMHVVVSMALVASGAVAGTLSTLGAAAPVEGVMGRFEVVSLQCPLSMQRINYPGRGRGCDHLSCFDIKTYVAECCATSQWNCPICLAPCYMDSIVASQVLLDAIESLGAMRLEECNAVRFYGGTTRWEPVPSGRGGDAELDDECERPFCKRGRIE